MAEKSDNDAAAGPDETPGTGEDTAEVATHRRSRRASARERHEALSLIIEFFKMSRTTAVLLIAFVLTAALYMLVRQDPVVAFNSPPRPDTSQTDPTETGTSGTDTTGTEQPTQSDQPPDSTEQTETQTPTGTSGTEVPLPWERRGNEQGDSPGGDQPQPQQTQSPQAPQSPAGQPPQQSPPAQQPQQFGQTQVPAP